MNITIFNTSSGEVIQTVSCPLGMASLQISSVNEDWIEGTYPAGSFYIENYLPIKIPDRPSTAHVFNYATKQWEDPRTLSDLKAAKNAAINAARLKANQSHFTFAGKQIAVDPLSRSDIDAAHGMIVALQAMPPGWPGGWKAMDNTICAIPDLQTWLAFYGAMVLQWTANFNHAQALKAQLAAG